MSTYLRFLTLIFGSESQLKFWDNPKLFLKKQRFFCTHLVNPKRCKKQRSLKNFQEYFQFPNFIFRLKIRFCCMSFVVSTMRIKDIKNFV